MDDDYPTGLAKQESKKDIVAIMAAHRIPYAATATTAYPEDLIAKVAEAKKRPVCPSFSLVLAPSQAGGGSRRGNRSRYRDWRWRASSFPPYEMRDGHHYRITVLPKESPVREFLRLQGRYAHY